MQQTITRFNVAPRSMSPYGVTRPQRVKLIHTCMYLNGDDGFHLFVFNLDALGRSLCMRLRIRQNGTNDLTVMANLMEKYSAAQV